MPKCLKCGVASSQTGEQNLHLKNLPKKLTTFHQEGSPQKMSCGCWTSGHSTRAEVQTSQSVSESCPSCCLPFGVLCPRTLSERKSSCPPWRLTSAKRSGVTDSSGCCSTSKYTEGKRPEIARLSHSAKTRTKYLSSTVSQIQ